MKTVLAESHFRNRHIILARVSHDAGPSTFEIKEVTFHDFKSRKSAEDWIAANGVKHLQRFDDGSTETA